MNRLKTEINGKMPITLDDHRWSDAGYRDAFYGIASAFGITEGDSFKISGCAVTVNGSTYTTTAGYICWKGEVLKVNAHSITVSSLYHAVFALEISHDVAGLKIFQNDVGFGQSHDTYEIRLGKLTSVLNTIGPPYYMEVNAPYIETIIANKIKALETGWQNLTLASGWQDTIVGELSSYKKDAFGEVTLKGCINNSVPTGTMFTLPVGFRPPLVVYKIIGTATGIVHISIATDGDVSIIGSNAYTVIYLNDITFKT